MARVEKIQYITQGATKEDILQEVKDVISGGCRWVQLRMKKAEKETIVEVAKELKELCSNSDCLLIVNDSVEICHEIDADGVHLGKEDITTAAARKILGDDKIIGRTCNSAEDIVAVSSENIDYIGLGPLRFTTTKERLSPVIGEIGYEAILKESNCTLPVVAVGGIVVSDLKTLQNQGVFGVAISGVIYKAVDRAAAMAQFIEKQ